MSPCSCYCALVTAHILATTLSSLHTVSMLYLHFLVMLLSLYSHCCTLLSHPHCSHTLTTAPFAFLLLQPPCCCTLIAALAVLLLLSFLYPVIMPLLVSIGWSVVGIPEAFQVYT